jgi:hypothetical protein
MKIYKNLLFAYSFEAIIGLTTSLLIILFGAYALGFLAFLALRPLILETREITARDDYWFVSYQLMKYSIFIISFIIIGLYLVEKFVLGEDLLFLYRNRIIILFPFLLFVHGILGLFSLKDS